MEFGGRCEEGSVQPLSSLLQQLRRGGGRGRGWLLACLEGFGGGWDCCLCVIVVQKRLCLFQGFTLTLSPLRGWVGDPRQLCPPYLQATSCSGEELEELCPSLVSTRQRRYFLPLPSFFFVCSPTLFLPLFCQSCVSLSSSCTRRRAVGLCCSDTLDVTTGLFVAIMQDVCLFIYFLFQLQNGQGFFFIIPTCHITCIRNFNNNSVCYARCLFKQSFNTNNSNQLVYTFKSAPCVVGKCV